MSKWISVEEGLPEERGFYLGYGFDRNNNRKYKIIFFLCDKDGFCKEEYCNPVTHWTPLPKPPEVST